MSLTLSAIPGFTEVPAANFNAGATASDADMKSLNADALFAAVRYEQFWGYYKHGETVALPVSAADGYTYARNELLYTWSTYWTGSATGAVNGTQVAPARGATSGAGALLQYGADIDNATGVVSCNASYYVQGGATTNTNDGIVKVLIHAVRLR